MTRAEQHQFRIIVKSDDGGKLRYEEPFTGTELQGKRRARIMWARSSYIVSPNKAHNRDCYVSLEVWAETDQRWVMVKEHRGRLPRSAAAPREN